MTKGEPLRIVTTFVFIAAAFLAALGWLIQRIFSAARAFTVWLEAALRRAFPYDR